MSETTTKRILNPSFFHGWSFLSVEESNQPDALPIIAVAKDEGPTVVINTNYVTANELEVPFSAMIWVPLVLRSFASSMFLEAIDSTDGIGAFKSERWEAFRNEICHQGSHTWDQLLEAVRRLGIDYMSEAAVADLYIESGIHNSINSRANGVPLLFVA